MNITNQINAFAKLVNEGIKKWQQAGTLLVDMADKDPSVYTKIVKAHAFISLDMLMAFEKIGRKQLHPLLLLSDSTAARKVASLPYRDQKEIVENGVYVLDPKTKRGVKKSLDDITSNEVRLVFDGGKLRSVEEQATLKKEIEDKWNAFEQERSKRFIVNEDGSITFFQDCTFTRSQLEEIIEGLPKTNLEFLEGHIKKNQIHKTI